MGSDQFTRAEIEAGRNLFASNWQFVAAAGSPASLPVMKGAELEGYAYLGAGVLALACPTASQAGSVRNVNGSNTYEGSDVPEEVTIGSTHPG